MKLSVIPLLNTSILLLYSVERIAIVAYVLMRYSFVLPSAKTAIGKICGFIEPHSLNRWNNPIIEVGSGLHHRPFSLELRSSGYSQAAIGSFDIASWKETLVRWVVLQCKWPVFHVFRKENTIKGLTTNVGYVASSYGECSSVRGRSRGLLLLKFRKLCGGGGRGVELRFCFLFPNAWGLC